MSSLDRSVAGPAELAACDRERAVVFIGERPAVRSAMECLGVGRYAVASAVGGAG